MIDSPNAELSLPEYEQKQMLERLFPHKVTGRVYCSFVQVSGALAPLTIDIVAMRDGRDAALRVNKQVVMQLSKPQMAEWLRDALQNVEGETIEGTVLGARGGGVIELNDKEFLEIAKDD